MLFMACRRLSMLESCVPTSCSTGCLGISVKKTAHVVFCLDSRAWACLILNSRRKNFKGPTHAGILDAV